MWNRKWEQYTVNSLSWQKYFGKILPYWVINYYIKSLSVYIIYCMCIFWVVGNILYWKWSSTVFFSHIPCIFWSVHVTRMVLDHCNIIYDSLHFWVLRTWCNAHSVISRWRCIISWMPEPSRYFISRVQSINSNWTGGIRQWISTHWKYNEC